jgi:hypothetical protein
LYYNYSPFLILIGYLLFIGSLVCVIINKFFVKARTTEVSSITNIYNFFADIIETHFMRKQNLNNQTTHETSTKEFKKK